MRILKNITLPIVAFQFLMLCCLSPLVYAASGTNSEQSSVANGGEQSPGFKGVYGPNYPMVQDSYFADDFGNILMIVNVLGMVNRPGQIIVPEDADLSTLITIAGGLREEGNPQKVLVIRKEPESNGKQAYKVDLRPFFEKGDRSTFVMLQPNDTVVIPEKKGLSLALVSQIVSIVSGSLNTMYYIKHW